MKQIRILALVAALASMLAIGASVSAQTQDQTMDDSSTTTIIEQQTVTTPADQANPPASVSSNPSGTVTVDGSTFSVVPLTDSQSPASNQADTGIDYSQNPYWGPKDWNYISTNDAGSGGS